MSSWPVLSLREAGVRLIDCVHKTPPARPSGYPYVTIPQMKNGRIDFADARRISHDDFVEWTRKARPQVHDVVLSRRTNPGVTATFGPNVEFALGQNLVLLRADGTVVEPAFLRWLTASPQWWAEIEKYNNVGAVFDSLKCADVPKFELPIPPKPVQSLISQLLGALDDKIELNRRMNETLEAMAEAIFRDWFVDFGPVRRKLAGETDPVAVMGGLAPDLARAADLAALFPPAFSDELLPEAWESSNVGDEFDLTMGQSPPGETYNDVGEGLPFFQGRTDFGFRFPERRKFCSAPTRTAAENDTLISVRAPVGDLNVAWEACCIGRGVAAARHKSGGKSYTFYAMRSLQPELESFEHTGTVFGAINKKQFERLSVVRPPSSLVKSFELLAAPLDDRIRLGVMENRILAETRDYLLPRLMSGEVRVTASNTESAAP